ncbi:hypothetical protein LIER_08240 [Lithospermum erythrorhizon]|uniref:Uncharacterized protein n=1 Tax=Lithospermum erythrorhizon TaxID=34254 RepID=A0AAV3PFW7_LITER
MLNNSSEEDEAASPLLRRYVPFPGLSLFVEPLIASILTWAARCKPLLPLGETSASGPRKATPKPQGAGGQGQSPPPTADHSSSDTPVDASVQYCTTIVLNPDDQGEVGSTITQSPPPTPLTAMRIQAMG